MTRAELRALCEAATAGPWRVGTVETDAVFVPFDEGLAGAGGERNLLRLNAHFPHQSDAALIVAARTELPALLDQLDAAEAAHATTRDLAQARIDELERELTHAQNNLAQVRAAGEILTADRDELGARRAALLALTLEQAEDEALWLLGETNAREAHLQDALRQLHRAIEEDVRG